jgi:glucose/mannose-6-phosphate isomerase
MNLDDSEAFRALDGEKMIVFIDGLPRQLQTAWELGLRLELPAWTGVRRLVVSGMGGSAIGADLLAAYCAERSPVSIHVHRNYGLPAWVSGPENLVVAVSHSGDTEETLSSLAVARERGCRCLAITTGGGLAKMAVGEKIPVWQFEHHGQPRAAVGFSFAMLLAMLNRLELISDTAQDIAETVAAMLAQRENLRAEVPAARNPAKRYAGQFVGRLPVIFGSDLLEPVARRWKTQINEIAKAWAQFETLPEADHNTLAGVLHPEGLISQVMALFLRSSYDLPRNRRRNDLTRQTLMIEGVNTDTLDGRGASAMAQQWTLLHFGDYVSYYLAMAYGVDPTPVEAIESFKQSLKTSGGNPQSGPK